MWRSLRPVTLYHYVVWEYLRTFVMTLSVCLVIIVMAMLVSESSNLEDWGITYEQLLPLTPYFLPAAMTFAMPAAAMFAVVLFFGRMSAENEVLAAQSGGASLAMLALPILFCGVVFSAISLWCSDVGVAWGFTTLRDEVANITKPKVLAMINRPGNSLSWRLDSGSNIRIDLLSPADCPGEEGKRPIHVAFFDQGKTSQSLFARHFSYELSDTDASGRHVTPRLIITLEDGQSFGQENPKKMKERSKQITLKRFGSLILEVPLPSLSVTQIRWGRSSGTVSLFDNYAKAKRLKESRKQRYQFLNERALDLGADAVFGSPATPLQSLMATQAWVETQRAVDDHELTDVKIRKLLVEFHRKLAIDMLPLFVIVLGLGLGLLVRKSARLLGFLLALMVFFIVCYPLSAVTKELAGMGYLPPISLWSADLVALTLGVSLCWLFEHGYLAGSASKRETQGSFIRSLLDWLSSFLGPAIARITESRLSPFRYRADRHVVTQFLSPLIGLCLAVGAFCVVLDLAEHGGEVVESIRRAQQPPTGLPVRSVPVALLHVVTYYGVRMISMIFRLMPMVVLISAMFVVYNMIRNNEHLIFKSSGTRLQRALLPLLLTTLALAIIVSALREVVMPGLLLEEDQLKPLVYNRSPRPKSISGTARDEEGRPFVFEIARYTSSRHLCEGVRFYFPERMVGGRLERLEADAMQWDPSAHNWIFKTAVTEGGEKTIDSLGHEVSYVNHGLRHVPEAVPGDPADDPARFTLRPVERWAGQLTPTFIEGQDVGPSVVRFSELWDARDRPEFRSELWRRLCDWMTAVVLVLGCVPFLLRREGASLGVGIALSIPFATAYLCAGMFVPEIARLGIEIPEWSPLLPHLLFLTLGFWRYFWRMET